MQDGTECVSVRAEEDERESATLRARAALVDGRFAAARAGAQEALERFGPSSALYAVLGRAHSAEDADDHDDRADAVYRRGLTAFPDDLDLLAGYAELCLRSDPFDRPARHGRGPGLMERLRAVAPGSPQVLRAEQTAAGQGRLSLGAGARMLSASRMQRHDARQALAEVLGLSAAVLLTQEQSRLLPHELRLAVRAETLAALARRGRGLLVRILRTPLAALSVCALLVSAIALARPAFHLPAWVPFLALALCLPHCLLSFVLRGARRRAESRVLATPPGAERVAEPQPGTDIAAESAPEPGGGPEHGPSGHLPPSPLSPLLSGPAPSRRERLVTVTTAAVIVTSVAVSLYWSEAQYRSYPRYTTSAPAAFHGAPLLTSHPVQASLESTMASVWNTADGQTFSYAYGKSDQALMPVAVVFGVTGDFHETSAEAGTFFEEGLRYVGNTPKDAWNADPGQLGGRLRCVTYAGPLGGTSTACSWADKGSIATVVLNEPGLDREAAASSARALRERVLHLAQ
ncbi:hypothetical protein ACFYPA_29110 [Streptomyces sp. NPDC005775]|uniref:hypothetical protein n=1 Tax=Streptomyces sp. NPDC005775 TaxID=3364729 RepID=UPI00367B6B72